MKEAKGIKQQEDFETAIDLELNAFIPPKYIPNEYQKLDVYKRIAAIESQEEYEDMLEELMDRFGEPPKAVENLLAIAALKALAHKVYITEIKQTGKDVKITMFKRAKLDPAGFPGYLSDGSGGGIFQHQCGSHLGHSLSDGGKLAGHPYPDGTAGAGAHLRLQSYHRGRYALL